MSSCFDSDDLHLDTKKLEINAKKVGFRDGISDGQDGNFQKSFNEGFRQGFRNAFALSQYKASLSLISDKINEPLLDQPERSWCEICKNPDAIYRKLDDLINQQTEISNSNLQYLNTTYSKQINYELPSKLDK